MVDTSIYLYYSRRGSQVAGSLFMWFLSFLSRFLLPVWSEMAVGSLFSPLMCVLLAQSATRRQPTTGILLLVQREVNIRRHRSPGVLFCRSEAFGLLTCDSVGSICSFCETGSGCLPTGSSFVTTIPYGDLHLSSLMHLLLEWTRSVPIWMF